MLDLRTKYLTFQQSFEAGMSSDLRDTGALVGAPFPQYGGKGIHTNKGIIWNNFKRIIGNYPDRFLAMNHADYAACEVHFWLAGKANLFTNYVLAEFAMEAVFGSTWQWMYFCNWLKYAANMYGGKFVPNNNITQAEIQGIEKIWYGLSDSEKKTFYTILVNKKLIYLKSLPNWTTYQHGWTRRINELTALHFGGGTPSTAYQAGQKVGGVLIFIAIAWTAVKIFGS